MKGWLNNILTQGRRLRKREYGSELPDNPTPADFKKEMYRIAQMAKEVQNTERPWSDDHWKKISKAIEALEKKTQEDKL